MPEKKTIKLSIPTDLETKVSIVAKQLGISRQAFITLCLAQTLKTVEALEQMTLENVLEGTE